MDQKQISARPRVRQAKNDSKRLRRQGLIPSIVYGGDADPRPVTVDEHEIEMILRGGRRSSAIFNLKLEGAEEQALLRALDRHPVTSRLVHIDFQRVNLDEEIEIDVPVHSIGQIPTGVRAGGILEHAHRTVTVRCKPLLMPAHIDADLSNLGIHQTFHVSDLKAPEGVEIISNPETALYSIVAPSALVEAVAPAEAVAVAEPEVIGKKKTDEDEKESPKK